MYLTRRTVFATCEPPLMMTCRSRQVPRSFERASYHGGDLRGIQNYCHILKDLGVTSCGTPVE